MAKNMVSSSKKKNIASLHDLTEFAVAKAVTEDFPRILSMYDKLLPALNQYQQYLGVASVVIAVQEAQTLMRMQLEEFEQISKNKGKISGK